MKTYKIKCDVEVTVFVDTEQDLEAAKGIARERILDNIGNVDDINVGDIIPDEVEVQ